VSRIILLLPRKRFTASVVQTQRGISFSISILSKKVVIMTRSREAMNNKETLGRMRVTFGTFLASVIVSKLTFGIVSIGQGLAQSESVLYIGIAVNSNDIGSELVVRIHQDGRETASHTD